MRLEGLRKTISPRFFLKTCWKNLPPPVRLLALSGICSLRASKRSSVSGEGRLFVLGAFGSTSGIAHGARLYADKKEREGLNVARVDVGPAMLQRADLPLAGEALSIDRAKAITEPGTAVIHANPPQFQLVLCRMGKKFLKNKRIIGYWAWELETIPEIWKHALKYVDAVAAPSNFVRNALRPHTLKEIILEPHSIPVPARHKTGYAEDGVVRCLYSFDLGSSCERKNPLAALRAFKLAFQPGEAELTFKVTGANEHPETLAGLKRACAGTPGVRIVDAALSQDALSELYLAHDIYLSLHRSEGYGLTIREAMLHDLHVVATGWSGNMDFMRGPRALRSLYARACGNKKRTI